MASVLYMGTTCRNHIPDIFILIRVVVTSKIESFKSLPFRFGALCIHLQAVINLQRVYNNLLQLLASFFMTVSMVTRSLW